MKPHRINLKSGGKRLKFHRVLRGLSQPEVAKKLKISRAHLVNLEQGRRPVGTWRLFTKLCNTYNIEPTALVAWYYTHSK